MVVPHDVQTADAPDRTAHEHGVIVTSPGLRPSRLVPLDDDLRALSDVLPADAQVAVDVGSVTYWYARHLRLPPGVPAHLSSTLASMG